MSYRGLVGSSCGVAVALMVSAAHAQCTKDTDCKGDRVCDAGSCVTGQAPLPPAPPAPAGAQVTSPTQQQPPPAAAPPAAAPPVFAAPVAGEADFLKPEMKRHSVGMMAGGIVMTSLAPIALLISLVNWSKQEVCESAFFGYDSSSGLTTQGENCDQYDASIYGFGLGGVALLGVGIPFIVIGAKKEPVGASATIAPWLKPNAGGVTLRLDM